MLARYLCPQDSESHPWKSFSQRSTKTTEVLRPERPNEGLAAAVWRLLGKRRAQRSFQRARPQVVNLGHGSVSIAACSTRTPQSLKRVKVLKRGKALLRAS